MIKSAIILAGGKGERLRPYTNDRPKPMVEINGKPILLYQMEQLKKLIITCSYQKEYLKEYLNSGHEFGFEIVYSEEESPLGRGGAIKQGMGFLEADEKDVLITNGDNLWKIDLESLIKKHEEKGAIATLVVVPLKSPYGIVEFNEDDEVIGFREKPILPNWVNAGVYIFSREIESLLPDIGDHETETFPKLPKEKFLVFQSANYWRGVDTVKDLTEAEKEVSDIFTF